MKSSLPGDGGGAVEWRRVAIQESVFGRAVRLAYRGVCNLALR